MTDSSPGTPTAHNLLTPLQRKFLEVFSLLPDQNQFFLTGGTALAEFYLGHRLSYDLDFFTSVDGLIQPVSFQLEKLTKQRGIDIRIIRRLSAYVEFSISDEKETLKIDLALDSPFQFEPPVLCHPGILVNSYTDLCTDKLLAYYGHAEPRDAVDLFCIIQTESTELLYERARQKDPGFDAYWFAIALNRCIDFPDEPERWPVKMLIDWYPEKIKKKFQSWAIHLMNDLESKSI
jgi:hypothetical protein